MTLLVEKQNGFHIASIRGHAIYVTPEDDGRYSWHVRFPAGQGYSQEPTDRVEDAYALALSWLINEIKLVDAVAHDELSRNAAKVAATGFDALSQAWEELPEEIKATVAGGLTIKENETK